MITWRFYFWYSGYRYCSLCSPQLRWGLNGFSVIKFKIDGEEYPAVVVVLNSEASKRIVDITKELCNIDVSGIEYLLGIRYINKFKTNSVTAKRDYLILQSDTTGYFHADSEGNLYRIDVGMQRKKINESEVIIVNV